MEEDSRALIVGRSRVERVALQTVLEDIVGLTIAYSLRGGQRVLDRLSTGDISLLFILMSDPEPDEDRFLHELGMVLCSGVTIVPVCTVSKADCLHRLQACNLRTSYYYAMPKCSAEADKMKTELARSLSRARDRRIFSVAPKPRKGVELVCIVSSTGGPEALAQVLSGLDSRMQAPIVITQHMPKGFVDPLCLNLSKVSGRPVTRAYEGAVVEKGKIYIAPGDAHLSVYRRKGLLLCSLDFGAPVAGCKPSGNVMLSSAAKATNGDLIAVTLTGMGDDGCDGMAVVHDLGGKIIAQNEATSVVWGMPGAVVKKGYAHHVLALDTIAAKVSQLILLEGVDHVSRAS